MEAALIGLQQKQAEVEERIAELKKRLGQPAAEAPAAAPVRKRRRLSRAARKRIAEATKKRWAEFRAKKAKAASKRATKKAAAPKRAAASKAKVAES